MTKGKYRKAFKGRRWGKKVRVAATGGVLITGYQILWGDDAIPGALGSPIQNLFGGPGTGSYGQPMQVKLDRAFKSLKIKGSKWENWLPLVGGALISASPRIPIISMVAAPVNNALMNFSKGKLGL